MEVTFINPGVDYMIQSIMHFQAEGEAEFWSEPLYHFYPSLTGHSLRVCQLQKEETTLNVP